MSEGYANFVTQQESAELPAGPTHSNTSIGVAVFSREDQIAIRKKEGWRKIRNRQLPEAGFRVGKSVIVDNKDGETCDVNIAAQVNIAAAEAAATLEAAERDINHRKAVLDYLCDNDVVTLLVALHNSHLGKEILPEDVRAEAEKLVP